MRVCLIFEEEHSRLEYGMEQLERAFLGCGYEVERKRAHKPYEAYVQYSEEEVWTVAVGTAESPFLTWMRQEEYLVHFGKEVGKEGFYLESCPGRLTAVEGSDETGTLYGCLELAARVREEQEIPRNLAFFDAPRFELRGPCIGLQKTTIEPPRLTYEYPITPGRFPWFYDKDLWLRFLDVMTAHRCNVLYLWSGHPFASLVKVEDYPEALEVTEEELEQNRALFGWLTKECDRRGIWVVLKFYNIHIPYEFAKAHGLEQKQSSIHPLAADYTRKSIVEFIKAYPHIGLMVCLGEALRGTKNKTDWFVDTIIPAVLEGIEKAGLNEQPPVILRGHDCDPVAAMEGAKRQYANLYTMWKYNGESLTTYYPSGECRRLHRQLRSLGGHHILNIHILANLEPFRYMAPRFIQRCVMAGENLLGGNGLHLYPLFYWDWPYAPDAASPRKLQMERDWMWYEAWFRYAWNPYRDERDEEGYWIRRTAEVYRCTKETARCIVRAMEAAGQCAPRLVGRIGITEGNRQTFSLGMTLSELTNQERYRPNRTMWSCLTRKGESLEEYAKREADHKFHRGETPLETAAQAERDAKEALRWIGQITEPGEGADREEIGRIVNDVQAIADMTFAYAWKIRAAVAILHYRETMKELLGDLSLLKTACRYNEKSLGFYRKLEGLTKKTYLYANSMQTPQRKIPFPDGAVFGHWTACLPEYEKEQEHLKDHIRQLEKGIVPKPARSKSALQTGEGARLAQAKWRLLSDDLEPYRIQPGEYLFQKNVGRILDAIPQIVGLCGIRMDADHAFDAGQKICIELEEDSQILIGYMEADDIRWLKVPDLETDTHADDQGGLEVVFQNAVAAEGCPPIHIHAFHYKRGKHEIYLGTGGFVIAGIIPESCRLEPASGILDDKNLESLDWLYEEPSKVDN